MRAAYKSHVNAIQELLNAGADVDCTNRSGYTPLILASTGYTAGHFNIVKILLASGADKNIQDSSGKIALDRAESRGHAATVKLLSEGDRAYEDTRVAAKAIPESQSSEVDALARIYRELEAERAQEAFDPMAY